MAFKVSRGISYTLLETGVSVEVFSALSDRGYMNAEWVLAEMDVTVPLVNHESVLEKNPAMSRSP